MLTTGGLRAPARQVDVSYNEVEIHQLMSQPTTWRALGFRKQRSWAVPAVRMANLG